MKILVVYYTRTNTTRKIAEELARKIGADIREIIDLKDRGGAKGYVFGGRDAMLKKETKIKEIDIDAAVYDMIILGTPVWVGTMSPALRTFVLKYKSQIKKAAIFTTQGADRRQRIFNDIEELVNQKPVGEIYFTTKEVVQNKYMEKLDDFINAINK